MGGIGSVILKEGKIETSQSRGKKAQTRRLRLLRAHFAYWVLFLRESCAKDIVQKDHIRGSVDVWSLHHQQRLCHHWTLDRVPRYVPFPHACLLLVIPASSE